MKKKFWINAMYLLLSFGGMLLYCGDWRISVAAWITPIFIIRYTRNNRKWYAILLLFCMSVLVANLSQHGMVPINNHIFYLISNVIFAFTFCIPFVLDRLFYRRNAGFITTLIFPSLLTTIEYLNSFSGYGVWGSLSHTQFMLFPFIQIASITGLFGITFIVAWFASIVNWIWEHDFNQKAILRAGKLYFSLLFLVFFFGEIKTNLFAESGKTVRIAAIQNATELFEVYKPEIDPSKLISDSAMVCQQLQQTEKAATTGAEIIAWHEGALIVDSNLSHQIINEIITIAKSNNVYVLVSFIEITYDPHRKPFENKNTMIAPTGEILWSYLKSKPVPGGELPFVEAGNNILPYADTKYGRLGTAICFDMDFPSLIHQSAINNVDIMLVPASDWEGITPFHSYMASMEAIQNGFSLVRICAHGYSSAFDYNGKLLAGLNSFDSGGDKILICDVPQQSKRTLYGYTGNIFPIFCILFLIGYIIWKIVKFRKDNLNSKKNNQ